MIELWNGYWWIIVPHILIAAALLFLGVIYYSHKGLRIILPALAAIETMLPLFTIAKLMGVI